MTTSTRTRSSAACCTLAVLGDPSFGDMSLGAQIGAALLIAWAAMMVVLVLLALRKSIRRGRVLDRGIRATARVEALTSLAWSRNRNPGARLSLTVMPPAGAPYSVTIDEAIPQLFTARVQPGQVVPVAIDPNNPQLVVLDLHRS